VLDKVGNESRFILITSAASVEGLNTADDASSTELDGLKIAVSKTEKVKCVRCWHHTADVGTIAGHEEICGRCVENIEGEGETREFA